MMNPSTRREFLMRSVSLAGLLLPITLHANDIEINAIKSHRTTGLKDIQQDDYLSEIKIELKKEWPGNRSINLVFHGHSVPSGYFKGANVNTLSAYPHLLLTKLKELYPTAVINCITTSIGGENSQQGAKRINSVLDHQPDVIFIDYALNDRGIGLVASRKALTQIVKRCSRKK